MTSPTGPAVIGRSGGAPRGAAAAPPSPDAPREFEAGPLWMRILPPLVMLGILLWGIREPSFWRDEAATLAAIRRPFGDMVSMLGNVDAVHGGYYAIIWGVARLAGTSELVIRLPSAIAMVIASVAVTALGRRLVSARAGFAAGMLFALIPNVSFYGQDARSYAMVTAMAAISSYLLIRAAAAAPPRRRGWLVGYAVSLTALGLLNVFALLLIPAHAVTVALRCRGGGTDRSARALARGWLAAAAAAMVVLSPLLVLAWKQRGQISWLRGGAEVTPSSVERLIGTLPMFLAVAVVLVIAIVIGARAGRDRLRAAWPGMLLMLCVPWVALPAGILLGISAVDPMYTFRYILFCAPAAALLGGTALAALGRALGTVALVTIAALAFHAQVGNRLPDGHGDNIRQADQIVAMNMRPGDTVLYTNVNAETFGTAYPFGLGQLRDVAIGQPPDPSATLAGTNVPQAVLRRRLAHVSRLWVVDINNTLTPVPALDGVPLHQVFTWRTGDISLLLYAS
jgi:mannosyltransferase